MCSSDLVVKDNIEIAAIVIVAVSVLPLVLEFVKHRRSAKV